MEPIELSSLSHGALLLVDTPPIIYVLEGHAELGPRFRPLFEAHGQARLVFAVTTVTIAEVLTGPLRAGDEVLARRCRTVLEGWRVVD
ncbi:MAG: type II toxin-antitoxin system VapC family toxin, partial [Caulobacteraceae bacterium]